MLAEAILCGTLVLAVTKTFLLVDAVFLPGEGSGVTARVSKSIHRIPSARSPVTSPRQQPPGPASAAGASKARGPHRRLLCMHVTAALVQGAGAAKYLLPVSDTSCVVTHRVLLANVLLNDASLVLFLLAKVHVTNGSRGLACWEKGVIWWSRLYACLYLPFAAYTLGRAFPGRADAEGKFCYNGWSEVGIDEVSTTGNARSFGLNNASLVLQFMLLLGLFVKPLLVPTEGTQSGGAMYRRVVVRNTMCTVAIVASYAITTIAVVLALLRESSENNTAAQVRDVMIGLNSFSTLCLTEITLPLGFSSGLATCRKIASDGRVTKHETEGNTNALRPGAGGAASATAATTTKVVPVQDMPPQAPQTVSSS